MLEVVACSMDIGNADGKVDCGTGVSPLLRRTELATGAFDDPAIVDALFGPAVDPCVKIADVVADEDWPYD